MVASALMFKSVLFNPAMFTSILRFHESVFNENDKHVLDYTDSNKNKGVKIETGKQKMNT